MLVNINTALASITKPSAINTEEWSQLGIRFNWGQQNHQAPPRPFFSVFLLCSVLKMNFIISASVLLAFHACLSHFLYTSHIPPSFFTSTIIFSLSLKSKMQL